MGGPGLRRPGKEPCTGRQSCICGSFFRKPGRKKSSAAAGGACSIDASRVECDYYQLLKGNPEAEKAWSLTESYLQDYTWAEETAAGLSRLLGDKP